MATPIRILLVDDHPYIRLGIRSLLTTYIDFSVIGEAGSAEEAVKQAAALEPDVIIMDLVMPGAGGVEAIKEIAARQPQIRILVLTSFNEDDKVFAAIKAGALGYLMKDSIAENLIAAIYDVYHGRPALASDIALKLMREVKNVPQKSHDTYQLTTREIEVLNLLARGHTNSEIGEQLFITERTVSAHINRILKKLQVSNRTQAALVAREFDRS